MAKKSKSRGYRKNGRKKQPITRSLKNPGSYFFKRQTQQIVNLTQSITPGSSWVNTSNGGIAIALQYALDDLSDSTDFKNLFKYYKINAARVQIFFSVTNSSQEGSAFDNNALICMMDKNLNGSTAGLNTQNFLDSQTAKTRAVTNTTGKPMEFYCKLKQSAEVYGTGVNTDYQVVTPKFISTDESTTPHYGNKLLIERVSGESLTDSNSNYQYMRIITTYYIECKKVH